MTRAHCNYRRSENRWHVVTLDGGQYGRYVYWDWAGGGWKPSRECQQIATDDRRAAEALRDAHNTLVALERGT